MSNHYKRSKWQAEVVARELAAQGLPVVIVNPSAPIGPRDVKPTPTGQIIVDFLNRRMPAYLDTGLNWVHVRDVAAGEILAAEKGRVGERYILGNAGGNWTMRETLAVLEELSGVPAPNLRVPYFVALTAAYVNEAAVGNFRQTAQGPSGGGAHGKIQDVFQPGQGHQGIGPAPNAAAPGLRGCHRMVQRKRLCPLMENDE